MKRDKQINSIIENKLDEIASDSVEFISQTYKLDVTNKGKSIVASAIFEAMKECFNEGITE